MNKKDYKLLFFLSLILQIKNNATKKKWVYFKKPFLNDTKNKIKYF